MKFVNCCRTWPLAWTLAKPEVNQHIASCDTCAAHLRDLQKTMALLDEWQAPEPSPYFDTRLQARSAKKDAKKWRRPQSAWLQLDAASGLGHVARCRSLCGALVVGNKSYLVETGAIATNPPSLSLPVQPGTAVGDLQALERNDELYADFDVLDDLQVQNDVTANP